MTKQRRFSKEKTPLSSLPHQAMGLALLGGALLWLLCLICLPLPTSPLGLLGSGFAHCCFFLLGLPAFFAPLYMGILGILTLKKRPYAPFKTGFFLLFTLSCSQLLTIGVDHFSLWTPYFNNWVFHNESISYLGGIPLQLAYDGIGSFGLKNLLGDLGATLIFSTLALVALIALIPHFLTILKNLAMRAARAFLIKKRVEKMASEIAVSMEEIFDPEIEKNERFEKEFHDSCPDKELPIKLIVQPKKNEPLPKITHSFREGAYTLPSIDLITAAATVDSGATLKSDLRILAKRLEETLQSFSIEAKVGNILVGPTITSFEVHPAVGVKVQKILTLENDIALNLQAKSIRIVAPIPGKAAVGIEVPNREAQEVGFKELLQAYQGSSKRLEIPLLLGRGIAGDPIFADMTKMPHLIIAGATGSGKSVCINVIVMSILMNCDPEDVKLLIVDPKKVELGGYSPLPHMISPVITEAPEAFLALSWLVKEMERRYALLRDHGLRHIQAYTQACHKNKELEKLPYIVVIIDELADLMMMANSDMETPIIRLAQMARAIGIHLILATQRPSREVITGLIKANFPTRIAFKVSSRVNSQIILDDNGAEALLGSGDLLFLAPAQTASIRAQGAYVRDDDINRVIEAICKLQPTNYRIRSFEAIRDQLQEKIVHEESLENDPLLAEAKALIFETGTASTTFLQRKLKIGYARAAALMDALEAAGVVGPQEGAKPRKIFFR